MSNSDNNQFSENFMVPHPFRRDDRIVIDDVEYGYDNTTSQGHTFRRYEDGLAVHISHDRVWDLISTGRMVIHPTSYHPGGAEIRQRVDDRNFDDLTPMECKRVEFRTEWCDRFLECEREYRWVSRSDQKMRLVLREIMIERNARNCACARHVRRGRSVGMQETAPSPATVRAWLRSYERAHFDVMALADNYRRPA